MEAHGGGRGEGRPVTTINGQPDRGALGLGGERRVDARRRRMRERRRMPLHALRFLREAAARLEAAARPLVTSAFSRVRPLLAQGLARAGEAARGARSIRPGLPGLPVPRHGSPREDGPPALPKRRAELRRAERRRSRWRAIQAGAGVTAVGAGFALVLVLLLMGGGPSPTGDPVGSPAAAKVAGYGLEEVPDPQLADLAGARFISITTKTAEGLRSTMVSADRAAFQTLLATVTQARPVSETVENRGDTLTFVLPDRRTAGFVLDLDRNLLGRQGKAWKPVEEPQAAGQLGGSRGLRPTKGGRSGHFRPVRTAVGTIPPTEHPPVVPPHPDEAGAHDLPRQRSHLVSQASRSGRGRHPGSGDRVRQPGPGCLRHRPRGRPHPAAGPAGRRPPVRHPGRVPGHLPPSTPRRRSTWPSRACWRDGRRPRRHLVAGAQRRGPAPGRAGDRRASGHPRALRHRRHHRPRRRPGRGPSRHPSGGPDPRVQRAGYRPARRGGRAGAPASGVSRSWWTPPRPPAPFPSTSRPWASTCSPFPGHKGLLGPHGRGSALRGPRCAAGHPDRRRYRGAIPQSALPPTELPGPLRGRHPQPARHRRPAARAWRSSWSGGSRRSGRGSAMLARSRCGPVSPTLEGVRVLRAAGRIAPPPRWSPCAVAGIVVGRGGLRPGAGLRHRRPLRSALRTGGAPGGRDAGHRSGTVQSWVTRPPRPTSPAAVEACPQITWPRWLFGTRTREEPAGGRPLSRASAKGRAGPAGSWTNVGARDPRARTR